MLDFFFAFSFFSSFLSFSFPLFIYIYDFFQFPSPDIKVIAKNKVCEERSALRDEVMGRELDGSHVHGFCGSVLDSSRPSAHNEYYNHLKEKKNEKFTSKNIDHDSSGKLTIKTSNLPNHYENKMGTINKGSYSPQASKA